MKRAREKKKRFLGFEILSFCLAARKAFFLEINRAESFKRAVSPAHLSFRRPLSAIQHPAKQPWPLAALNEKSAKEEEEAEKSSSSALFSPSTLPPSPILSCG